MYLGQSEHEIYAFHGWILFSNKKIGNRRKTGMYWAFHKILYPSKTLMTSDFLGYKKGNMMILILSSSKRVFIDLSSYYCFDTKQEISKPIQTKSCQMYLMP